MCRLLFVHVRSSFHQYDTHINKPLSCSWSHYDEQSYHWAIDPVFSWIMESLAYMGPIQFSPWYFSIDCASFTSDPATPQISTFYSARVALNFLWKPAILKLPTANEHMISRNFTWSPVSITSHQHCHRLRLTFYTLFSMPTASMYNGAFINSWIISLFYCHQSTYRVQLALRRVGINQWRQQSARGVYGRNFP